jgi:hypothetical protein
MLSRMGRQSHPRTEAEWQAYERAQKGLRPEPEPRPRPKAPPPSKAEEAQRKRAARARDPIQRVSALASVTKIPIKRQAAADLKPERPSVPTEMGEVERGIREQCANLPKAQDNPGLVALAIKLGQQLDSPDYGALAPGLARNLAQIMATLSTGPKAKSCGRLATVALITAKTTRRAANG